MISTNRDNVAIISVGSNIQPSKYIHDAIEIIQKSQEIVARSQFVQTKPIGFTDQDDFINGALKIKTKMKFEELSRWLKKIEIQLGRVRTQNKNGPRTIDLDIVAWNGIVTDQDVRKREYLKNAVLEVAPDLF